MPLELGVVAFRPRKREASSIETQPPYTLFFISPAYLGGERAGLVFRPGADFELARQLRSPEGAALGELFSFLSGLYFRGKMTYAQAFGRAPEGLPAALVISPGEGLRFLHERLTLERLRAWAAVEIDEHNPAYTGPLLAHVDALAQALGERARFVLLGSVATDKYVRPLGSVLGERLLFPPDFVGRGDMSRGALLLRAARAGSELAYAPVAGATRQGPRAPGVGSRPPAPRAEAEPAAATAPEGPELVILIGLPGAGKSSFFRQRFAQTHEQLSLDELRRQRQPLARHAVILRETLAEQRSLVVDDTNSSLETRAALIAEGHRQGARVVGYFFEVAPRDCLARNRGRSGRERVPDTAILACAKRLVRPRREEGFDELRVVRPLPDGGFEVEPD